MLFVPLRIDRYWKQWAEKVGIGPYWGLGRFWEDGRYWSLRRFQKIRSYRDEIEKRIRVSG